MRIGVIGAGRMAQAIGWLAVRAGHEVMLSNSRRPNTLRETNQKIGSVAGTVTGAAEFGEVFSSRYIFRITGLCQRLL